MVLCFRRLFTYRFLLHNSLVFDLDVPENVLRELRTPYTNMLAYEPVWASGTVNSYITVNNSDGYEAARIDDTGISLRMENQSWLKTKVANWLGVKYL